MKTRLFFVVSISISITLFGSSTFLYSYIYNLQEWSNGKQTLFLFSDIHCETLQPFPQRIDLINAAKFKKAFVIVEDDLEPSAIMKLDASVWKQLNKNKKTIVPENIRPFFMAVYKDFIHPASFFRVNPDYSPNTDYSHLLPRDYLTIANQHISPLICLTQFCRQQGIPAKNVDFRFGLCWDDVVERHEQSIAELNTYQDGPILAAFYTEVIKCKFNVEITAALKSIAHENLLYHKVFDELFDSYLTRISDKDRVNFAHVLNEKNACKIKKQTITISYDLTLIDANFLHEIYCNSQYSSIFVCAGGEHIDNICKILQTLNFQPIPNQNIGVSTDKVLAQSDEALFQSIDYVLDIKKHFVRFHGMSE